MSIKIDTKLCVDGLSSKGWISDNTIYTYVPLMDMDLLEGLKVQSVRLHS